MFCFFLIFNHCIFIFVGFFRFFDDVFCYGSVHFAIFQVSYSIFHCFFLGTRRKRVIVNKAGMFYNFCPHYVYSPRLSGDLNSIFLTFLCIHARTCAHIVYAFRNNAFCFLVSCLRRARFFSSFFLVLGRIVHSSRDVQLLWNIDSGIRWNKYFYYDVFINVLHQVLVMVFAFSSALFGFQRQEQRASSRTSKKVCFIRCLIRATHL